MRSENPIKTTSVFNVTALLLVLALIFLARSLHTVFKPGLRKLPGPILARFSGLYRLSLVYAGRAPYEYRKMHQQYGPIVRIGPSHVSVSDPAAIPQIYGIGTNYLKVMRRSTSDPSWLT
jgi:hypothetical protein